MNVHACVIDGTPLAASSARDFVAKTLPGHPRLDDLVLVVSELATNAVRHSASGEPGGWLTVVVSEGVDHDGAGFVCLEVIDGGSKAGGDGGPGRPYVRPYRRDAESGYGLTLVVALSHRWGHHTCGERRTVWAVLRAA